MNDAEQARFEGWAREQLLAYAAGLFDGEGCVYISQKKSTGISPSFGINVTLSNRHLGVLAALQRVFGGYVKHHHETRANQRDWYSWQLSGGKMAAAFLRQIQPYAVIKREQIDLALEFAERLQQPRNYRLPAAEIAARGLFKAQLSAMKRSA